MLDGEVYLWLESRTGESFDCNDSLKYIKKDDLLVTDPSAWLYAIRNIIDKTKEAIMAIDEYGDELPDTFPSAVRLKSLFAQDIRREIRIVIQEALKTLGMIPPDGISTATLTQSWMMAVSIVDLVRKLTLDSIEDVIKEQWYEKYDEDHDEILSDTLEIFKQDLPNIAFAIEDIREFHDDPDAE